MARNTASPDSITLEQLNRRIEQAVGLGSGLQNVWVTAETSDLRVSTHSYTELIQKDPDTGAVLARLRAAIWATQYRKIDAKFFDATGAHLASGIKVMLRLSVSFHPVYGLSAVVSDIDPGYTLGDLLQHRARILQRLRAEGVADMNRLIPWPDVALRIAIVSARGAAGYGDFIHQLYNNRPCLAFHTELFTATLQGPTAPASVMAALDEIAERIDEFDCVVIIRGGGAVSDLASFDDYDLANHVAQFPVPVVVGIGHERDVTVLDYVANMRVKTPTAAAEWLIAHGEKALGNLLGIGQSISRAAADRISAEQQRLARIAGLLPPTVRGLIERQSHRLDAAAAILQAISPEATLRRGFSITRLAGSAEAITDTEGLTPSAEIVTTLHSGEIKSTVTSLTSDKK